jgi:hypothetical protein
LARLGGLWLEWNGAIEYFSNVLGPAHRMRPLGDLQMTVDRLADAATDVATTGSRLIAAI